MLTADEILAPWNPEAMLIAPTTAPLASRVSLPPLATQLPPSKRPPPLDQMTLGLQEAVVLEELLFVFMVIRHMLPFSGRGEVVLTLPLTTNRDTRDSISGFERTTTLLWKLTV